MNELDPLKLQAGRGERTGKQRYRVLVNMIKHLDTQLMNTFQQLNELWH